MKSDIDTVRAFVAAKRRGMVGRGVARALLCGAAVWLAVLGLLQAGFSAVPWTALPFLAVLVTAGFLLYCAAAAVDRFVVRYPSLLAVARELEKTADGERSYLSLAIELARRPENISADLTDETARRAAAATGRYGRRAGTGDFRRIGTALVCALVFAAAGAAFLKPRLLSYWDLPLSRGGAFDARVEPGTVCVRAGGGVEVRMTPRGRRAPSCGLTVWNAGGGARRRRMLRPGDNGSFGSRLDTLRTSVVYSFDVWGKQVNLDTVWVVAPPRLGLLRTRLVPPRYTGLDPADLRPGQGSFSAYAGTEARFVLGAAFPLRRAAIVFGTGDSAELEIQGGGARGMWRVERRATYTFRLTDTLGQTGDSLPWFHIDLVTDDEPIVRLVKPGANRDLGPAQVETLWVEAADDIGVRALEMRWRRSAAAPDSSVRRDLSPARAERLVQREIVWNLAPLSLYPGDTVFYWAVAHDNRPWGPPRPVSSDTFWFRIPSFAEIHEQVMREQGLAESGLADVARRQESLRQALGDMVKSATGNKPLTWQEKEVVSDLAKEMTAQRDTLQKAVERLRESVERMREQGSLSDEVLDKMDDIREAVEDLVRQYGDSLLFEPPRADEEVRWEDMREGLARMEEMLPTMQEQLDNALRFLEALKRDRDLAMLASKAEKLAQEQAALASSEEPSGRKLDRQKDLTARERAFLDDVEKRPFDDQGGTIGDRLAELADAQEQAQAMQSEASAGAPPSREAMNRMSASLAGLAEGLRSMMSSDMMAKMEKERERLLGLAHDALSLSQWQSQVREQSLDGAGGAEARKTEAARSQQGLRQGLLRSRSRADSLSMVPPSSARAIDSIYSQASMAMDRTLAALGSGGALPEMEESGEALRGLAQTLLGASSDMDAMMQGGQGGAGAMMCGLRKLSARQAAVNAATSELLRMMMGGGQGRAAAGGDGEARAASQAAQKAIADKLRELADKYGSESGGGMEKRVEELEREARQLAEMLSNPREEVRDRQDRFLVKLLQTTLSMHKQDEGKDERTSESARTVFSERPIDVSQAGDVGTDVLYRLRRQALRGNFPPEYRAQVQAYFDSLGVLLLK